MSTFDFDGHDWDEITESEKRAIVQRLHEKLEAVEAVRPETDIDPERLARALYNTTRVLWSSEDDPWFSATSGDRADARRGARKLIAAYRATPLAERPE